MSQKEKCFVIMPISDPEGYDKGHFRCVYEDIFKPAIEAAGYEAFRVDDKRSSNMIQESIIRSIIDAPMAICDLSTRNPNVLFELGIRQAFDLPVVLVQEENTPRIFDISTINTIDYRNKLKYREVLEDRENITTAINETKNDKKGINSIIKLLQIKKAELGDSKMSSDDETKILLNSLLSKVAKIEQGLQAEEQLTSIFFGAIEDSRSVHEKRLTPKDRMRILNYMSGGKYKVYEVAKELNFTSQELMNVLIDSNSSIKSHMSTLKATDYDILKAHLENH